MNKEDWKILLGLREAFLSDRPHGIGNYWDSPQTLELYDTWFAKRISWKWDAVLKELVNYYGKELFLGPLVDWGCGTGIASRTWIKYFGNDIPVYAWDRSRLAMEFAREKLRTLKVKTLDDSPEDYTLLLSHVLGELPSTKILKDSIKNARSIIWIEPGTSIHSRKLIEMRELLREEFKILAPCPHQEKCGLFLQENHRHWCHHFAPTPSEVFQNADWSYFSKTLSIDLHSLPLSYLVLYRKKDAPENVFQGQGREIGVPRIYKGYAKALICREEHSLKEEKLLFKKEDKKKKEWKDNKFTSLYPPPKLTL